MAMIDIRNSFTYAYSAGTYADQFQAFTAGMISMNEIDLDVAGIQLAGSSKPPYFIVRVGTVFAGNTGGAQIKLVTHTATIAFDGSGHDILCYRFAMAVMAAGALLINQALPHFDYERYLRMEFEPFTADASGGTLCAYLSDGPEPAVTVPHMTVEDGFS